MPVRPLRLLVLLCVAGAALALSATARAAISLPSGFEQMTLADGFASNHLVDVTWAPDGRMFMADRAGIVYVHKPGDPAGVNSELLDISDHVNNGPSTDHGLLSIATDSDFASNGYLYLLYTYDNDAVDDNDPKVSTLTRVTVTGDTVVGGQTDPTETTILGSVHTVQSGSDGACGAPDNTVDCIPSEGTSHSVATVRSVADGTLYVGTGDGDDYTKVDPLAMNDDNPATYRGKIMHVDRDGHGLPGHPFCPGDNTLTDVCTKVYAEGFRNPFRFSLRPTGGLAIGDVGQGSWEEIDLANGGEDFGWPCFEGNGPTPAYSDGHSYGEFQHCQDKYANNTTTPPAMAIAHSYPTCDAMTPTGNTIVGGAIYEGDQYPTGYRGELFFGDVGGGVFFDASCGWLARADISGGALTGFQNFATGWPEGVDIESAPDGNLVYVSLSDGAVRELVYGPGNHAPTVSASATPASGTPPLSVSFNAVASDPDGDGLHYDWDFGDGSPPSTAANPTHVYTSAGNRTATVTVDDGRGMSASASVSVSVTASVTRTPLPIRRLRLSHGIARLAARGILSGSFTSSHSVKTVDVSLWRGKLAASASCRWWSRRSHRLRSGACSEPHWMKASLHRKRNSYTWKVNLRGVPSAGRYTLILQAIPRDASLGLSERLHRSLRVPRRSHAR